MEQVGKKKIKDEMREVAGEGGNRRITVTGRSLMGHYKNLIFDSE